MNKETDEEFTKRFKKWKLSRELEHELIGFIDSHFVDRRELEGMKKNVGYDDEDKEEPTIEDETIALAYESQAEAFYAGYDQAIEDIKNGNNKLKTNT